MQPEPVSTTQGGNTIMQNQCAPHRLWYLLCAVMLLLAACGGGGGGSGAAPPPASTTCVWDSSAWDGCTFGG